MPRIGGIYIDGINVRGLRVCIGSTVGTSSSGLLVGYVYAVFVWLSVQMTGGYRDLLCTILIPTYDSETI